MKSSGRTLARGVGVLLLVLSPVVAFAQGARLQLDSLNRLSQLAAEVTDISLDESMLGAAGDFFLRGDLRTSPELKKIVSGLRGVYVRSYEFNRENAYSPEDLQPIRKQLSGGGWTRIVSAEDRADGELVEIYVFRQAERADGLAILAAERDELTVVNIVGPIDMAQLAALGGSFGIPRGVLGPR